MFGFRIFENPLLTVPGSEDWSRVRSPSRARRRRKYGHRQNIVIPQLPDPNFYVVGQTIYCHPALAEKLRNRSARHGDFIP